MALLLSGRDDVPVFREGKLGGCRPFLRSLLSGGAPLSRIPDSHRTNHRADLQSVAGCPDHGRPSLDRDLPVQSQDGHTASSASDPLRAGRPPLSLVSLGASLVLQPFSREENSRDLR